jgi:hypothetical protein
MLIIRSVDMEESIVIADESAESEELSLFLLQIVPYLGFIHALTRYHLIGDFDNVKKLEKVLSNRYPELSKYVILGLKNNPDIISKVSSALKIETPQHLEPIEEKELRENIEEDDTAFFIDEDEERWERNQDCLAPSWDSILSSISESIAIVCAVGGSKALIGLLKSWVEERGGRKIRIKKGDIELEVQGGVSESHVKKLVQIFEEKFEESRIIKP